MKTMLMFCMLLTGLSVQAENTARALESRTFRGQSEDRFDLSLLKTLTRYRTEYRDSTCTRSIPYTAEECGHETRYREECRWQAGRNECRTDYENRCRTITRYRRECRRDPNNRDCRMTDPTRICRNGVCRDEPGRRICEDRKVCTRVPYQDRECTREPRRICDWVPGRNICDQIPFQDWVCRNVTRYRQERYACKEPVQIPFEVEREVNTQVTVNYKDTTDEAKAKFDFKLLKNGKVEVKAIDQSEKPTLIEIEKDESGENRDDNIEAQSEINIRFLDQGAFFSPIDSGIQSVGLNKNALWFSIGKVLRKKKLQITATIVRDGLLSRPRTLFSKSFTGEEVRLTDNGSFTKVLIDLSRHNLDLKKRKYEITIDVKSLLGDSIVNLPARNTKISRSLELRIN